MTEENLREVVDVLVLIVEAIGAAIIFVGAIAAFYRFIREIVLRRPMEFMGARLFLARFLALGLEFQLAADILRTAVAPSFEQIGKLAAIAAIRTALNYFLHKEIQEEVGKTKAAAA